jgi:hypothetical protein
LNAETCHFYLFAQLSEDTTRVSAVCRLRVALIYLAAQLSEDTTRVSAVCRLRVALKERF